MQQHCQVSSKLFDSRHSLLGAVFNNLQEHGYAVMSAPPRYAEMLQSTCGVFGDWFKEATPADKRRHAPSSTSGLTCMRGKEVFAMRLDDGLLQSVPEHLLKATQEAYEALFSFAQSMLVGIGRQLRAPPHAFAGLMDELPLEADRAGSSILHISHYIQGDKEKERQQQQQPSFAPGIPVVDGRNEHVDTCLLTVVFGSTAEGLEVQNPITGEWKEPEVSRGQVVVLPGLSLERVTMGRIKAATHRVTRSPGGRTSRAFKLRLRSDTRIDCSALLGRDPDSLPDRYKCTVMGAELMREFEVSHPLSVNRPVPQGASFKGAGGDDGEGSGAGPSSQGSGDAGEDEEEERECMERERMKGADEQQAKDERVRDLAERMKVVTEGFYHLDVKTLTGYMYRIQAHGRWLVINLKDAITDKAGIPFDHMMLIYNSKQIDNDDTLQQHNLGKGCAIHMVTRL